MDQITGTLQDRKAWPTRAYASDAGLDLKSINDTFTLKPGDEVQVHTGVALEIPAGHVGLLFPRSGSCHELKNTIGVIDCDYRGEIIGKVKNSGEKSKVIKKYDKVFQLIIVSCITPTFVETNKLSTTKRGSKGFGHSGE